MAKTFDYEKWWVDYNDINRLDPGTRIRKELIIREIKNQKYKSILDIGCGSGELLVEINKEYPKKKLTGTDVSEEALELVKKKKFNDDTFLLDLEKPVENPNQYGEFDAVICSEVIEHLKSWRNTLEFMGKVTHKGSKVIVTTQSGKRYPHHLAIGHLQHFEPKEITNVLEKNNFKILYANKLGWPFMDIKNLMVTYLLKGSALESGKISTVQKIGLRIFYYLYKISLRGFGPQIVVIAERK